MPPSPPSLNLRRRRPPPPSPPPLRPPLRSGDPTYLSLARAHSPHLPSLLSLLRSRPPPFPEHLFPPFFSALSLSPRGPHLALRLFDDLLPRFRCPPTSASFNSALSVLSARRPDLAPGFFARAVREHPGVCPNALSFNLLIKARVRCGEVEDAAGLLGEMRRRGLRPDGYSYSTVIDGLCKAGRVDEALGLLDEMQV